MIANSAAGQEPKPPAPAQQPAAAIVSVPTPAPTAVAGAPLPSQAIVGPSASESPAAKPGATLPSGSSGQPAPTPAPGGTLPQIAPPAFEEKVPSTSEPAATPTPPPPPSDISVTIDLAKQRAYLLRCGVVELESPVSSGRATHLTPTGDFSVLEKDLNHRSTLYGSFVKNSGGRVVQRNAQSKMPAPAGSHFEGAPMKFFVRFEGAAGTHAGYLPGYPASHGCVRMPAAKAEAFYKAVQIGTPVRVFGQAPVRKSDGEGKKSAKSSTDDASKPAAQKAPAAAPSPTPKPKRAWWTFGKHE